MSLIERLHVSTNQDGVIPIAHLFQQIVDTALLHLPLGLSRRSFFPYQTNCFITPSFSPETFERFNMTNLDRGHDIREPIENVGILMILESLPLIGVLVDDEFEDT
ncbi:hypothetical protein WM26_31030 [Burkholderia cepacia]|nr:hypothetical protein WM26_31030 [Burkholderia cepacia]